MKIYQVERMDDDNGFTIKADLDPDYKVRFLAKDKKSNQLYLLLMLNKDFFIGCKYAYLLFKGSEKEGLKEHKLTRKYLFWDEYGDWKLLFFGGGNEEIELTDHESGLRPYTYNEKGELRQLEKIPVIIK